MSGLADRIRGVQFSPVRLTAGYDMSQVDDLLDRLVVAAERGQDLGALIDQTDLGEVRLREGYSIAEVDDFLLGLRSAPRDPVVAEVQVASHVSPDSRPDLAARIQRARFTPVRMREGYDMGEVDQLLDRVEHAVVHGTDIGPLVAGARFTRVRMREGYDTDDVDAFLSALVLEQRRPPATADPGVITERPGLLERLFGRRS